MKYFIRTTRERTLDKSYSQIKYELLVDTEHNNVKAFVSQVKYLSTLDEDIVILEDDLILCKDFQNRIEGVIKQYPNEIINFYFNPYVYIPNLAKCSIFMWMQCVYFPKDILKLLSNNFDKYITNSKTEQSDLLVAKILLYNGIRSLSYRPCLVQHLGFDTLIHKKVYNFRTPYFIDYLDELDISYEDAKSAENKNKLNDYKEEWFKNYEKNRLHTS